MVDTDQKLHPAVPALRVEYLERIGLAVADRDHPGLAAHSLFQFGNEPEKEV